MRRRVRCRLFKPSPIRQTAVSEIIWEGKAPEFHQPAAANPQESEDVLP